MAAIRRPILNLTQHAVTPEQRAEGVIEPADVHRVRRLLTFEYRPDARTLEVRASQLAEIARQSGAPSAMIGGAPWLMAPLQQALLDAGIHPLYAFSRRLVVERPQADGSVWKRMLFRHAGFVDPLERNVNEETGA